MKSEDVFIVFYVLVAAFFVVFGVAAIIDAVFFLWFEANLYYECNGLVSLTQHIPLQCSQFFK